MSLSILVPLLAIALAAAMAGAWWVAMRTGESGRADSIWSLATGIAAAVAALVPAASGGWSARHLLVAAAVALWGLRLGVHIARRADGTDDPRYAELKAQWGEDHRKRLFWFLQIQAAVSLVLVLAVLAAARNEAELAVTDWLALALAALAILGEAVADRQLTRFRAAPANRGRICDQGLWAHSRHPNYFFEWLFWLSLPLFALGAPGSPPIGVVAFAAPLLMYWLLVHVSGIPPLEAHMLRSRGDAFRDYQARVNAFWPGPGRAAAPTAERRTSP